MTGIYKFNASIVSNWRSSLTVILSALRRVAFVVEDTFSWGDFNPQVTYSGTMTATDLSVTAARYLKIFNFMWIRLDIIFTPVAPLSSTVNVVLPATIANPGLQSCSNTVYITGVVSGEAGTTIAIGGSNTLMLYRGNLANYTANVTRLTCSGFFEVNN